MGVKTPRKRTPLRIFLIVFVAVQSALALNIPDLPAPVFADTEVAMNMAMMAWGENNCKFDASLQFDATPSNNVQMAFGTDESADGNLSAEVGHGRIHHPARFDDGRAIPAGELSAQLGGHRHVAGVFLASS